MKGRSLLALSVLALVLACEGNKLPTGPAVPADPANAISDGTRAGGNPDFFFLPPLVPNPVNSPNFERGKFNSALQPSLTVEICELRSEFLDAEGLPTESTRCVPPTDGRPLKKFDAGTVRQVGLPQNEAGWWTTHNLPAEGFYFVLWDTRESNLDVSKYYRIKVFVEGSGVVLGFADVDPMVNMREFRNVRTGDVIPFVDDAKLPIPFRIERAALCNGGTCTSATYTNNTPLTLQYDPDNTGSTAGVTIPADALPPGSPSVVVNIEQVSTGVSSGGFAAASTLCHPDIPFLQQFKGCYSFTTTPELPRLNEAGDQFIKDVLVAVCYELEGTGDPREKFAQLYSSSPAEEPSKWLDDVHEGTLIGALTKDCTPPTLTQRSSNPLMQLASTGWRTIKGGLGHVFGIKTAYAIDLGLGGLTKGFSHISPVLRVEIQPASFTDVTLAQGEFSTNVSAKIVAQHFHTEVAPGVNGVPVTFSVTEGNGTINGSTSPITVNTASLPAGDALNGFASVAWTVPTAPGTYSMTADAPAYGGPITYHATVPQAFANPVVSFIGSEVYAASGVFVRFNVPVTNYTDYPAALFAPRPDLPPCGLNTSASRTWVSIHNASNGAALNTFCALGSPSDLQLIWFAKPQGQAPPSDVYVKLTDRETGVTYTSSDVSLVSPNPVITFGGTELYTAGGSQFVRYNLPVTNYTAYKPEMFAPAPLLDACGANTSASRTWVDIYDATTNGRIYGFCGLGTPSDLQNIWMSEPVGTPPPSQVYITLTDRATGLIYTSNNVSLLAPTPVLAFLRNESYAVDGVNYIRSVVAVTNHSAYPAEMFAAAPSLPPCGLNTSASRTWVEIYDGSNNNRLNGFCAFSSSSDMLGIWSATPQGTLIPSPVYIKIIDRATGVTYTSNAVATRN